MKICMIGNSQMACLKQAWPAVAPAWPDLQVGFFGAPGEWLDTLAWMDGSILSSEQRVADMLAVVTGGAPVLNPADWDGFVLAGLSMNVRPHRTADWLDRRLSAALRHAVLRERFATTTMAHVLRLLRRGSAAPVWLMPNPRPRPPQEAEAPAPPSAQSHAEALADLRQALEGTVPGGPVHVVGQPEDTLLEGRWTQPHFGEGAMKLIARADGSQTQDSEDRTHMNPAFGARMWQVLLADPAFSR